MYTYGSIHIEMTARDLESEIDQIRDSVLNNLKRIRRKAKRMDMPLNEPIWIYRKSLLERKCEFVTYTTKSFDELVALVEHKFLSNRCLSDALNCFYAVVSDLYKILTRSELPSYYEIGNALQLYAPYLLYTGDLVGYQQTMKVSRLCIDFHDYNRSLTRLYDH